MRVQQLDLTQREKALAAKTTVCAYANYASRVGVMPNKTVSKINMLLNGLLWDSKPPPVKRNLLQLPESSGGLGLPHVLSIIRVLALKRARLLYQSADYIGKTLLMYWAGTRTGFLDAGRHPGPHAEIPSAFYKAAANTQKMIKRHQHATSIKKPQ